MATSIAQLQDAFTAPKVNGAAMPATEAELLASIKAMKAENAVLAAAKSKKAKRVYQEQTKCPFEGQYPANATATDRLILDAVWATRGKLEVGSTFDVPASNGKAVFTFLHALVAPLYPPTPTTDSKKPWDWSAANAALKPHIKGAVSRGIITERFGVGASGVGFSAYFDAREKAPLAGQVGPNESQMKAAALAFGK